VTGGEDLGGREEVREEVLVDARWLEPPEPLERVLATLELLRPGRRLRLLIHREPLPLYGILDLQGHRHETRPLPDSCYEVLIEVGPSATP
jgi:tRNA 2-thiouridine synthesizing protein A